MTLYNLKTGNVTVADASGTTATDAEINTLAGVAAGTATGSKAVVLAANKSIATLGAVTMGALTATTGTFSGAVAGTTVTGSGIGTFSQIKAREFVLAVGADGAITIPAFSQVIAFTKAGACTVTLADPTATTHDGVLLIFVNTTAQANVIDNSAGSGFNAGGAGSDIGTSTAAIGNYLKVLAYQGKWYVVGNVGYTLA